MTTNHYHHETLALHVGQETPDPASDAHAVCLTTGVEHIDDIIADHDQAFAQI